MWQQNYQPLMDSLAWSSAAAAVPILVPLPFLSLGLLVCVIQTLVFVLLSMIYIGLATADAHGHDDAHAPGQTHGEPAHAH